MRVRLAPLAAILLCACLLRAQSAPATSPADSLLADLGQNLVVGIPGPMLDAESESSLRRLKPAGIVLYRRNYQSRDQLRSLIQQLQQVAQESTGSRYLIMIDEEPGGVTRLGLFINVFALGEPRWEQIHHDLALMHDLGITVDLAPILDFPFHRDSFILNRNQAHTVPALVEFNTQFIAACRQQHIAATLKHFPGMGIFSTDPHQGVSKGRMDSTELAQSLEIFRSGIKAGAELVMTSHGVYENIDPDNPATVSRKIVIGLLRGRLHFQGLIITDDISDMPLITSSRIPRTQAAVRALLAGHTIVLFSHQLSRTEKIAARIYAAALRDPVLHSNIAKNARRVREFKKRDAVRRNTVSSSLLSVRRQP